VEWDKGFSGYRVTALYKGDMWSPSASGPLSRPGVNVEEGDVILKVCVCVSVCVCLYVCACVFKINVRRKRGSFGWC
jgi:hypothetical protein